MRIRRIRNRHGFAVLMLIGMIVVLGGACAVALHASLDTYRVAVEWERRLQAGAAAEGALVLLDPNPAAELDPAEVGKCTIEFEGYDMARAARPFRIRVYADNGLEIAAFHYRAEYETAEAHLRLRRLEMIP